MKRTLIARKILWQGLSCLCSSVTKGKVGFGRRWIIDESGAVVPDWIEKPRVEAVSGQLGHDVV